MFLDLSTLQLFQLGEPSLHKFKSLSDDWINVDKDWKLKIIFGSFKCLKIK